MVNEHEVISWASEQPRPPEDPRGQLVSGQTSGSHLSEHNFGIKGKRRGNDAAGVALVQVPAVGLNCKISLLPSTCLSGLCWGQSHCRRGCLCSSPAGHSGVSLRPINHSQCARVWLGLGEGGLLLVLPLIWAWGVAS